MDLITIIVFLFIIYLISKRVTSLLYFIAVIDIFFRIVAFINSYIPFREINNILYNIPASIPAIINKYSSGIISDILMWALVACYVMFESYIIQALFRRK